MLLPEEHTVMVNLTSRWGQFFLMSLIGLGATAFGTSWFYKIDEVITVQGRLIPQEGGVEVKSPVSGQLDKINVINGQQVAKDEILFKYDVQAAKDKKENIEKRIKLETERIQEQLKSNDQRQVALKRNIQFTKDIINRLEPLEKKGAISEIQILQEKNRLESQKDELIQLKTQRLAIDNDGKTRRTQLQGQLNDVENRLRNESIIAPIAGTVFELAADNDRYVTTTAERLLKIVPKGDLAGEVNITNQDIGFIKAGQDVKVRVDSFPYTVYGEIEGSISSIGADALPPTQLIPTYHFPVGIKLEKSTLVTREGMIIPLQAGMTINTTLKLRDRRLIQLLGDIFNDRGESLKRLRQP